MYQAIRRGTIAGLVVVLAACGGNSGPTAGETPSTSELRSPSAQTTPPTISAPRFPPGEVGLAYSPVTVTATGGNPPYGWRISGGALPRGLIMSSDGTISGTPTDSASLTDPGLLYVAISKFTVEVTDSSLVTATVDGAISITPRLELHAIGDMLVHNRIRVLAGSVSTGNPFGSVSGGAAPLTYSITAGAIPPGTKLSGLALTGRFPPSTRYTYSFVVGVTDSMGALATLLVVYVVSY